MEGQHTQVIELCVSPTPTHADTDSCMRHKTLQLAHNKTYLLSVHFLGVNELYSRSLKGQKELIKIYRCGLTLQ